MLDLNEIEELLKSEELIKAVNRRQLDMLFHNTNLLKDPNITPEMKAQAQANIKSILWPEQTKKQVKPKAEKNIKAPAPVSSAAAPSATPEMKAQAQANIKSIKTPNSPIGQIKLKYHPVYQHYGIDEDAWNKAPSDAHHSLFNYHNEVMAGKHPEKMHIKNAIEAKMKKSLDQLYNLFSQLNKAVAVHKLTSDHTINDLSDHLRDQSKIIPAFRKPNPAPYHSYEIRNSNKEGGKLASVRVHHSGKIVSNLGDGTSIGKIKHLLPQIQAHHESLGRPFGKK